jgi:hypothetical protein
MTMNEFLKRAIGVYANPQTYLNLLYLIFAFPLGLFYFVFFVTGFSLGIGLIILWIGLILLVGVLAASWGFTALERQMAISLLRIQIPPMSQPLPGGMSFWEKVKYYFKNPVTWKGLLFLLLKFPIGLVTFIVTVVGISLSLGLMSAPILYRFAQIRIGIWQIHTLPEAIVCLVFGFLFLTIYLHFNNLIAGVLGKFAQVMLGLSQPVVPATPAPQPDPLAETQAVADVAAPEAPIVQS